VKKNATVTISVERKEPESILVIITGSCPQLTEKDLDDLFIPTMGIWKIKQISLLALDLKDILSNT